MAPSAGSWSSRPDVLAGSAAPPFTVGDARQLCLRRLQRGGFQSAEAETAALIEAATGLSRTEQQLKHARALTREERVNLANMLHRRLLHEPLQHITGTAPFYGLELAVSPAVLIPRPETERLVELVLEELRTEELRTAEGTTVLDVGTGSGAIALALKSERADLEVWASDVSPEALSVAIGNAGSLGLAVKFRRSDLLADPEVAAVAARAAALVANLPYLPSADERTLPAEVRRDPPAALFGGADGLEVANRFRLQAAKVMMPGALLAMELDERNAVDFLASLRGWREARLESDLTQRQRFVLARR